VSYRCRRSCFGCESGAELNFRRQHPIGEYVLDFYCPAAKLAIEVDGAAHDFGDRPRRDDRRTEWLGQQDVQVLRVPAKDVLADPDAVADAIVRLCNEDCGVGSDAPRRPEGVFGR